MRFHIFITNEQDESISNITMETEEACCNKHELI